MGGQRARPQAASLGAYGGQGPLQTGHWGRGQPQDPGDPLCQQLFYVRGLSDK